MRRRSEDTEREYEERRRLVAEMLGATPRCRAGAGLLEQVRALDPPLADRMLRAGILCSGSAAPVDVHEILPRSAGGSITDRANCVAVCRACHRFIHGNPKLARAAGLLRSRYAVS